MKIYKETNDKALTSAFAFSFLAKTFIKLTDNVREIYGDIPVIYAGGVMSSRFITARLARDGAYFSKPEFSADNAAGIALLARERHLS